MCNRNQKNIRYLFYTPALHKTPDIRRWIAERCGVLCEVPLYHISHVRAARTHLLHIQENEVILLSHINRAWVWKLKKAVHQILYETSLSGIFNLFESFSKTAGNSVNFSFWGEFFYSYSLKSTLNTNSR